MILKIIEGKEGIPHHEHNWHLISSQSVEGDPTHLSGGFQEDAIEDRLRQAREWRSGKLLDQYKRCKLGIKVALLNKQPDAESST